jgi:hypothetical protein
MGAQCTDCEPIAASSNFEGKFVMPGLVPGIHFLLLRHAKDVDGRDEPGHDEH